MAKELKDHERAHPGGSGKVDHGANKKAYVVTQHGNNREGEYNYTLSTHPDLKSAVKKVEEKYSTPRDPYKRVQNHGMSDAVAVYVPKHVPDNEGDIHDFINDYKSDHLKISKV